MPWTADWHAIQDLDPFCSNKLWKNTGGSIHVTGTLLHHGKATDHLESLQQAAKSRKGTTVLRLAEDSLRPGRELWQFADKPIFASIFDKIFCFHLFSILVPSTSRKKHVLDNVIPSVLTEREKEKRQLQPQRCTGCELQVKAVGQFRFRCSLFFRWSLLKQEARIEQFAFWRREMFLLNFDVTLEWFVLAKLQSLTTHLKLLEGAEMKNINNIGSIRLRQAHLRHVCLWYQHHFFLRPKRRGVSFAHWIWTMTTMMTKGTSRCGCLRIRWYRRC